MAGRPVQPKTSEADEQALPPSPHIAAPHTEERARGPKPPTSEADAGSLPSNAEKNLNDRPTGGETTTGAQASNLKTLSEEAGEPSGETLSKAEASKRVDALQNKTGRGWNH